MTFNAEGNLFDGVYGGAQVPVFDDAGAEVERIPLPTDNPTRPCFGGPDLTSLYIHTAAVSLTDLQKAAQPDAGSLFVASDAGPGLPSHAFRL